MEQFLEMTMTDKILTEKQQAFLDALFGEAEGDPKLAAKMSGVARYHEMMLGLKDEIMARCEHDLIVHGPKAVMTMVKALNPTADDLLGLAYRLRAAEQILDRAGLVKKEKTVDLGQAIGLLILPEKKDASKSD